MWLALLLLNLLAAAIYLRLRPAANRSAAAELYLVYLLAGYCGIAQIIRSLAILIIGAPLMSHVQLVPGDPAILWLAFFGIGSGTIALLSIWRRGSYLLAPVLVWAIFWTGTTFAHLQFDAFHGIASSWLIVLWVFATHGLIALLLCGFYVASREQRRSLAMA